MTSLGIALYSIALILGVIMWRRTGGSALETLFERGAKEHHNVLEVIERHPGLGTWKQFREWMREENRTER